MSLTIDAVAFLQSLERVAGRLLVGLVEGLPATAEQVLTDTGYAEPEGDEVGPGPDLASLISDVQTDGEIVAVEIAVVYDWVIDPDPAVDHCDLCPQFAAGGPYTLETLPAEPGDGTTPCGPDCHCTVVPRDIDLSGAAQLRLTELAATALNTALGG